MLAITNDALVLDDAVYELGADARDLDALSWEFGAINGLLVPSHSVELAVLCTVDDFRLVAGSRDFVLAYAPDPAAARDEFLAFAESHIVDELRVILLRAARYMDWVDGE